MMRKKMIQTMIVVPLAVMIVVPVAVMIAVANFPNKMYSYVITNINYIRNYMLKCI